MEGWKYKLFKRGFKKQVFERNMIVNYTNVNSGTLHMYYVISLYEYLTIKKQCHCVAIVDYSLTNNVTMQDCAREQAHSISLQHAFASYWPGMHNIALFLAINTDLCESASFWLHCHLYRKSFAQEKAKGNILVLVHLVHWLYSWKKQKNNPCASTNEAMFSIKQKTKQISKH